MAGSMRRRRKARTAAMRVTSRIAPTTHGWGIAFDMNLVGNHYGDAPHQDKRLVATLERWGFLWGGLFVVPDGNHFEYRRSSAAG